MPDSTILTHAQTLSGIVCECIAVLDVEDCVDCFSRDDLCCNPVIGWGGAFDATCTTVSVLFSGSEAVDFGGGCINLTDLRFRVGVTLCVPTPSTRSNPIDDFNHFSECIMFLAENVHACLNSLNCCNDPNFFPQDAVSGQIVGVSGIDVDYSFDSDENQTTTFTITVTIRR